MNRQGLINYVSENGSCNKKTAELVIEVMLKGIETALINDGALTLTGFGHFSVNTRKARVGINPKSGERIEIGEMKVTTFRAGEKLKTAIAAAAEKKASIAAKKAAKKVATVVAKK